MYKTKLKVLKDSIIKLSLDPNDQLKVYNLDIPVADELALEFDDAFISIRNESQYLIQSELVKLLEEIDLLLSKMSTDKYKNQYPTVWDNKGLFENVDWAKVRLIAKKALIVINL